MILMEDAEPITVTPTPQYQTWLQVWGKHMEGASTSVLVPASARSIQTPLILSNWSQALQTHPNQELVKFFLTGISHGFRIGYNSTTTSLKSAHKNLEGALLHMDIVDDYLKSELLSYRVAGPFNKNSCKHFHISRFGVIPKRNQPGKWRLIVDLSHPKHCSVNDGIPKHLCSLSYITVDDAITKIIETGPNTVLAKVDIKHAFRLLPIHPADRHLLAMEWKDQVYVDTCLPFGLRSAPKLFNILADLLTWITTQRGVSFSMHYLDDFLLLGPSDSPTCQRNLDTFMQVCSELGIPLATEKLEGPSTSLTFLGILIDTHRMEARLPKDKLHRIQHELSTWLKRKKATKREILSLVGLLQHATKIVRSGRTFVSRMYQTAAKLRELTFFTRLNKDFRSDLCWWYTFISSWNGLSILRKMNPNDSINLCIQTDASGSWGCGACWGQHWFQWQWSKQWEPLGIMAKELVPIVMSCAVWGPHFRKNTVLFQCDNLGLVAAITKGSSKDQTVMHLLRTLWFFIAVFDIHIVAEHITGVSNRRADMLSRNNVTQFLLTNPQAKLLPTPVPLPLLHIISPQGPDWPDWTSHSFRQWFTDTITMVSPRPPQTLTHLGSNTT